MTPSRSSGPEARGRTSVSLLPDPNARGFDLGPNEEYLPPQVRGGPVLPLYPRRSLEAGCGEGTIALRVVVGADGRVSGVADSPLVPSAKGSCGQAFRESAETAVRTWVFQPATWRRLEPGDDYNGDGNPDFSRVVASETFSVYLDFRFDFEVVRGEGRVRVSPDLRYHADVSV